MLTGGQALDSSRSSWKYSLLQMSNHVQLWGDLKAWKNPLVSPSTAVSGSARGILRV